MFRCTTITIHLKFFLRNFNSKIINAKFILEKKEKIADFGKMTVRAVVTAASTLPSPTVILFEIHRYLAPYSQHLIFFVTYEWA